MVFLRFIERVNRIITPIGLGALLIMMTVVVVNVLGRALFSAPLYGAVEVVQLSGAVLISFIAAYTQLKKQNTTVGILVDRMSPRWQAVIDSFTFILCLGTVAVLVWTAFTVAWNMALAKEETAIYEIAKSPFRFVWVAGLIMLFVVFVAHFIESVFKAAKK